MKTINELLIEMIAKNFKTDDSIKLLKDLIAANNLSSSEILSALNVLEQLYEIKYLVK